LDYEQLAFQDPLTSIANRRAWDQELAKRGENRSESAGPICLALFDVDQLKQVNDSLGHAEGDAVLRATASALVASVRDHDFVARLGGDEFGVLLEDIDPTSAHRIVDRIRCSTSRYLATGETSSDEIPVTTSAGYACARPEDSLESLFRRGDQALLAAKRDGGNATTGDYGVSRAPVARRQSPVASRQSPVARRPSPVARRQSPVAQSRHPLRTPHLDVQINRDGRRDCDQRMSVGVRPFILQS